MRFAAASALLLGPLLVSARAIDASDLRPRGDPTLPFNVAHPGPTPAFFRPPVSPLLPVEQVTTLVSATTANVDSILGKAAKDLKDITDRTTDLVATVNSVANLVKLCGLLGNCPPTAPTNTTSPTKPTCLDSTSSDSTITSLLQYGGAGTTVYLCPGAVIPIQNSIYFSAANQTITTGSGLLGKLTNNRATLKVMGSDCSVAIYGADDGLSGCTVSNIIIDGGRQRLGRLASGNALIEMGGTNNVGQLITGNKLFEPRGWSALHAIEGNLLSCSGTIITNNEISSCGQAPTGSQFRKRAAATYGPGQWADGISLACANSIVQGNTITDATDGGIVIFQAPGSQVTGNKIIADQRQLLGALNAVDVAPFGDISFSGTVVSGNTIYAKNSMIKIGNAIGPLSWGSYNDTSYRTSGGTFSNNVFTSDVNGKGYFGFGITVDGHSGGTVQGNKFVNANFGGVQTQFCFSPMPSFGPLYFNPYTTSSNTLQPAFKNGDAMQFLICSGPGPQTIKGFNL